MSFKSLKSARTLTRHIGSAAFAAAICVAAVSSSSQAETPDYFLEWVESKAYLYVDTGIRGRCGTKAEVRFANLGGDTHHAMLAAAKITNGAWDHLGFCTMWGESMRFWYGGTYASDGYGYAPWGGDYLTEVEASTTGALSGKTTKADGTFEVGSVDWSANSGVIDTGTSLYLFAEHTIDASSGTEGVANYSLARFYHAKIWQIPDDGTEYVLVSDLRPCMKDGVAGVYDAVTDTILYPQGNALKAGPAKYDSSWPAAARVGTIDHPATQYGRIHYAQRGGMGKGTWKYIDLIDYTFMGEGDTSKLNGAGGSWQDNNLKFSQLRFDGWFYVDSAKAGSWAINQKFDDYFAFFIDNANVLYNNGYSGEANSTVAVAEGWHRFTIICGDTYGGYGSNKNFGGDIGSVPFVIAVNGATYAFNTVNFTQGSGLNRVALEADADWSDRGDVILASGAVLDLNGHNLTVKDIVCDDYVGAVVTNSASKKSVIYFLGEPTASKGLVDGLIKEVDVKIILAKNGDQVATWTGAVSSDPANANNWEDLAGEPVVPTTAYTVKIVGNNVNLQAPAGTDIACKVFEIGNCTLTTDCDWRGLSHTPTIIGAANLNGRTLTLNHLAAVAGSSFSGGEGSTVEFAPPSEGTTYAKMGESAFIDNIANLTTSGDVKFLISKDGAGGTLTVTELDLGKMHYAEFVQTNGTVNLGNVWCVIGGKDNAAGHGVYRMTGGTLTANIDFTVGSRGLGEFIQTGGDVTLNNWLNIGRNGGTGILTIDGGRMVNTFNREVYVGAEGGTGTINVGGNGYLEVHCLPLGAWGTDNTKGYVNISGNGHLKARNWVALCNNNSSRSGMWGEVNQSGGTFEITTDFAIGERSTGTGVYNLTGGDMTVRLMQIGWNSGSVGRMTMSGGTATTSSDFYVGRDGTGTFNLSGGDMTVGGLARISWGSGGVGTMTMDGGTFTVNGNQLLVADWGKGTFTQNAGTVTVTKASAYVGIGQCNGSSGSYVMNGGTVVTPGITGGAGTSTFIANGGTVKVASDNANVLTGVDTVIYATGGLTVDTDGHAATLGGSVVDAWLGSSFVKAGAGTLTAATFPAVDSLVVSNGVFALSASADNTIVSALAHRWSFNDGTLADSVTGSAEGTFSTGELMFEDGMLRLPGGNRGTAYADLGANRLPYESVTLEFWTTIQESVTWQKMFCIGKDSGDVLGFTFNRNNATGPWSLDVAPNGGVYQGTGVMSAQTPYYVVFTLAYDGVGTTIKGSCYNVTTGEKVGSFEETLANWRLTEKITQDKFALGSSFWNDPDAKAAYDEVRVWKGALSDEAIALSLAKGPNATAEDIAEIVAATSVASPAERTLGLASGATLNVGAGNTLRQPVLNVGGTLAGGNLVVTERMNVTIGETMSVTDGATLDLTGAELVVTNLEALQEGYTFATASSGGIVPAAPRPLSGDLRGYRLFLSRTKARIGKPGFTFIVR